ncbi:MAG: hypothetical protein NVS2B5_05200 [Beijerinckiaceae bacterium]
MIEQAMIFSLGFLVAGLLTLLFLPAFQRRAARLSARRLEMLLPLSMEEIVAERDQLRAEFAVERRRMEQSLALADDTHAEQLSELGRRAAAIFNLDQLLDETRTELNALGEAEAARDRELVEGEAALAAMQIALHDETSLHAATRDRYERLRRDHMALEQVANERRALLAVLETRAAALDLRVTALSHEKRDLEKSLQTKTTEAHILREERDLARTERDTLEGKRVTLQRRLDDEALRAADLADQIVALRPGPEARAQAERALASAEHARQAIEQRYAALSAKLAQQETKVRAADAVAAERLETQRAEIAALRGALEVSRREYASVQQDRRAREAEMKRALEAEIEKARGLEREWKGRHEKQQAEIAALAAALEEARRGRASLRTEPAPDSGLASQSLPQNGREETALLRQAISDLGSEVVRIAASLKAPEAAAAAGDRIPPDVIGIPEARPRVRAQP